MKNIIPCELCKQEATFYCAADSAFLCNTCDDRVHGANFLVARHIRQPLRISQDEDHPADSLSSSSSSSSACISTSESAVTKRSGRDEIGRQKGVEVMVTGSLSGLTEVSSVEGGSKMRRNKREMEEAVGRRRQFLGGDSRNMGHVESRRNQQGPPCRAKYPLMTGGEGRVDRKVEEVFTSWCRKIIGDEREGQHEVVVAVALRAIRLCMGVLPMRVALAASFWVALRMSKSVSVSMSMSVLERLEGVCGVPARLILVAEHRLARLFRIGTTGSSRCHQELQEGWAES